MDVYEAVTSRWSVRGFKGEPVSREVLERVLTAAAWAPFGSNIQPWLIKFSNASGLSRPLSHLRQAGLSEAVDKVVSYGCIAQRLGAEPMADREMRVGDQEQFCFSPRLLTVA